MTTLLTRDSDGESIVLDVVTSFVVSPSATVSRHPIEEGADIADHRHVEQVQVDLVCRITPSPLSTAEGNETGAARLQKVWDFLNTAGRISRQDRGTVTLSSDSEKIDTWENLVLLRWPRSVGMLSGVQFQLMFRQLAFATIERVKAPDRAITSSGSVKDKGENGTDPPSDADNSDLFTFGLSVLGGPD